MDKQKKCILLFFIFIPYILYANLSKDIQFSHLSLNDGLSHSTVFDINQDKDGNLWIATYDGINKYDGYKFKVYRNQVNNPNCIASDIANCIEIDEFDRVWIGTQKGLSLYNKYKDSFKNYYYKNNGQYVPVNSIVKFDNNFLLLATECGILLFDINKERFLNDSLSLSLHKLQPNILIRYGDSIYIGADKGVYVYTLSNSTLKKIVDIPVGIKIKDILCDSINRVWLATEGDGLYSYDLINNKNKIYRNQERKSGLNSNYVRSLAIDTENRLWVGTYGGLNIYNEENDNFLSIKSSEFDEGSLSQNSVRCIFKDIQGGMWLGTYWGGLNYYHSLHNRFKHIKHIPFINSLSNNVISCIVEDNKHNLWIGTSDGGLNFFDNKSHLYKNYLFDSGKINIPFKDIKTVYIDEKHNKVYTGAHAGGIMVLDSKTGHVDYFNRNNSSLPSNNIYSIISDGEEGLYIASLEYLLHFDINKRTFKIIDTNISEGNIKQNYKLLFRDSRKRIWVGRESGFFIFDQENTSLVANKDFKIDSLLKTVSVNCFYESSSKYIWIGTRNGLFALKENNTQISHYTIEHGLPSNVIYGILEDTFGCIWISTNKGLSCLNPENGKFRNFTSLDGLQANQFNIGAYCRKDNGEMMFGGINGITSFNPEMLIDNPYSPKPVVNKLFVHNKEVLPDDETGILNKSIEYVDQLTLSSTQNSFAISFVVSNYVAGKHNTFKYKLEGYDSDWYTQNDITPISYSNLPAGKYTFYIMAANNDGKWCEEPTLLTINILPVWYRTWWAILLLILISSFVVFGIIYFYLLRKNMQTEMRMERLDKEKQEEINQMKIRFYVNISHELRTPLTLIIAPLHELLNRLSGHWEQEKLIYIKRNTYRLLYLVNQLIDMRRAELGVFDLKALYSNAYKHVLNSFTNYEGLSKKRNIDYNFYTDLQDKIVLFDVNYLDIIVNNLLSNAFKFTDDGESITVKLYLEKNNLVLEVADSGVGIPFEEQEKIFDRFYQVKNGHGGSGIGLSLVQRLVELHHGKITLKSEIGKGSIFTVYLPQDESLYTQNEISSKGENMIEQHLDIPNSSLFYMNDDELLEGNDNSEINNKRGTILIVEDNKELRKYLVSGLTSLFNIIEVENGSQALDIMKSNEVDLILTDVMMPVMDGLTLCKLVKQNIETCHIPIFMLSARVDIKHQLKGLHVGADDYISKPFSLEILRIKIMNILRTRNRIFERYSNMTEVEPEKITNNTIDEELLRKAIEIVEKNLDNIDFSTEQFAREMNMSRTSLHLKLKALTGKSAIDFIHKIRFNRACKLLKEGKYSVSEISYMVGYNTPSYFATRFKKYMGCLPTEFGKNNDRNL